MQFRIFRGTNDGFGKLRDWRSAAVLLSRRRLGRSRLGRRALLRRVLASFELRFPGVVLPVLHGVGVKRVRAY